MRFSVVVNTLNRAPSLRDTLESVEALVDEADRQLYRAKAEGRNTLRHASADERSGAAHAGALAAAPDRNHVAVSA